MRLDLFGDSQRVRVVVVDHDVSRAAARALLEASNLVRIVGYADSVEQATADARALGPDVLVVDLRMPAVEHPHVFGSHPRPAPDPLSPQERRVLGLVATGRTNKEIARVLHISFKTVKNYLSNAYQKLCVKRRIQAVEIFRQRGKDPADLLR